MRGKNNKRKFCFIFGTRPEIIKLSPLLMLCEKKCVPFFSIHTGQHYSYDLDKLFFEELRLPRPNYRLDIKSSAPFKQGEHTGRMLMEIEDILLKEMPYCVIVQGDTNSVLAGALTAEKISTTESYTGFHIKVAHVEAGLRSYDRSMPEETNRFIADHLSDYLFTPTQREKTILLKEGISSSSIFVTGNTIVDAVTHYEKRALKTSRILARHNLFSGEYVLLTLHRQENVDSRNTFASILKGVEKTAFFLKVPIIFPMHPRTKKMLEHFNLSVPENVKVIEPVGFFDFLALESQAKLALTDSGGVQEECCILKVPCVTLRNNTERPQTVRVGANLVAGTEPPRILSAVKKMLRMKRTWKNPFGDGRTSERILQILQNR